MHKFKLFLIFCSFVQNIFIFFAALRESTGGALLIDILFGCTCQILFFLQNIFSAEYFFCNLQNIFFCICGIFFSAKYFYFFLCKFIFCICEIFFLWNIYLFYFGCEIFLFFSVVKNIIIFILKIIIILYYTLYNIFISYTL